MKRISRMFKNLFQSIALFFDRWLITPITKLILKITDLFTNNSVSYEAFFRKKSTLLVTSLLLAFGIFVYIDQESNVIIDQYAEILYNQPVTAYYNEELYVVEGLPDTVDITLVGDKTHIFLAKQSPSKGVSVDLTDLKPGNHKVTLEYNQRLKSVDYKLDPSQITISIYEKESTTKSVTYDILNQDNLDSKLFIEDVELERTDVIVKGASHQLEKVASIKALLDVDTIANPKEGEIDVKDIPLVAYDEEGNIVEVEIVPGTVDAKVVITSPSKEVPIKVVPVGDLAFGKAISSIKTSVTTVTVYGQKEKVDELNELEIELDVKDLQENKEFTVTLEKPSGITELSVTTVKVEVILSEATTKEFKDVSIVTENLDDKYKVQALSENDIKVTIVVSGSSDAINALDINGIKAYIDLEGYGVGEHEVPVKVIGDDLTLSYTSKTKNVTVRILEK